MPQRKTKLGHFVSDDSRFILLKIIPRTNTRAHRRFILVAFDADMCFFFLFNRSAHSCLEDAIWPQKDETATFITRNLLMRTRACLNSVSLITNTMV